VLVDRNGNGNGLRVDNGVVVIVVDVVRRLLWLKMAGVVRRKCTGFYVKSGERSQSNHAKDHGVSAEKFSRGN
jgi:hypothetical protein